MSSNSALRVQKHRHALRGAGLRPIQIWVPNTQAPGFLEECRRQSALVATSDRADKELMFFLDDALADLDEA
ncbi:antitoxin MazE family protein [Polynucleobacter sp.]|jgi:hypothetical protein|uniref:antitoxin MazE family protein n=1 Tax=Polynucleobacter sp. TaxID=2029855 RepID=UPI0037C64EBE